MTDTQLKGYSDNVKKETIKMRAGRHIRISLADWKKHDIQKGEVVLVEKARKGKYLHHGFEVVEKTDASTQEIVEEEKEKREADKVSDKFTKKELKNKLDDMDVDYKKSALKAELVDKYLEAK